MSSDATILSHAASYGLSMGELFLAAGRIYESADAGDFQAGSAYRECLELPPEVRRLLIDYLRRLSAPEYASIQQVDLEISQAKEWEQLLSGLEDLLQHDPQTQAVSGEADFVVFEDRVGGLSAEVLCRDPSLLTPSRVASIHALLVRLESRWAVVVSWPDGHAEPPRVLVRSD